MKEKLIEDLLQAVINRSDPDSTDPVREDITAQVDRMSEEELQGYCHLSSTADIEYEPEMQCFFFVEEYLDVATLNLY